MKVFFRKILAVIAYLFLFLFDNWPAGAGVNDRWDRLMKWAKRSN